jgi:hypothetical protein
MFGNYQDKKSSWMFWGLFACLILVQFLLFRTYAMREVVGYYPPNHDQTYYLMSSYHLYEEILKHGVARAVIDSCHSPTGFLMPVLAGVFFMLTGASRFNALLLNFSFFVSLQIVMIKVVRDLSGKLSLSVLAVGLLLAVNAPFFWAGGMMDFRIDFMAFSLFGIFVSTVMKSRVFELRKWSLIAGLIASVLILLRYITAVYIVTIFCPMATYLLLVKYGLWRSRRSEQQKRVTLVRIKNLFLCSGAIAILTFPFLWINRGGIYNYYFIGHVLGEEKNIRAAEQGITGLVSSVLYYPRSILLDHIGVGALAITCVILSVILVGFFTGGKNHEVSTQRESFLREGFGFLTLCILSPILVLTLDTSKSPVVGNIVVAPFLWMVIFILLHLNRRMRKVIVKAIFNVVVIITLLYAISNQFSHYGRHGSLYDRKMLGVTKMYEDIALYCKKMELVQPRISVDRTRDYLAVPMLSSFCYEINDILLKPIVKIGNSIFSISRDEALRGIRDSDIVIVGMSTYKDQSVFPFDISMKSIRPIMKKALHDEFMALGDYYFDASQFRVYVRPDFAISGLSGDWITSEGIVLRIPSAVAKRASEVVLEGTSNFEWVSPDLKVYAEVINTAYPDKTLETRMMVSGDHYLVRCYLPHKVAENEPLRIRVTFSEYFVPKDLGINEDTRKLVIMAPRKRKVVLR